MPRLYFFMNLLILFLFRNSFSEILQRDEQFQFVNVPTVDFVPNPNPVILKILSRSGDAPIVTQNDASALKTSGFVRSKETKILVHDHMETSTEEWIVRAGKAIQEVADVNVIALDWETFSRIKNYLLVKGSSHIIAAHFANLILLLEQETRDLGKDSPHNIGEFLSSLHLICFGLGAHICGFTGYLLRGTISRITGLDPSGLGMIATSNRLKSSDARFVDIIHTNGDPLHSFGIGMAEPIGHVDFYGNIGAHQPGCNDSISKIFSNLSEKGHRETVNVIGCSHRRAVEIFIESIYVKESCKIQALPCENPVDWSLGKCLSCPNEGCPEVGYGAKARLFYWLDRKPSTFYFLTNTQTPLCGRQYAVQISFLKNAKSSFRGVLLIRINGSTGSTPFLDIYRSKKLKWNLSGLFRFRSGVSYGNVIINDRRLGEVLSVEIRINGDQELWSGGDNLFVKTIIVRNVENNREFDFCDEKKLVPNKTTTILKRCAFNKKTENSLFQRAVSSAMAVTMDPKGVLRNNNMNFTVY